eukprot:169491-Rhodomonas_salina.3
MCERVTPEPVSRPDVEASYHAEASKQKGVSVLQFLLLILSFEGRPSSVGNLNPKGQWIWVCAGAVLMPFAELVSAVQSQGCTIDDPRLLSFCGVEAITQENYAACFKTGAAWAGCYLDRKLSGPRPSPSQRLCTT